MRLLSTKIPSFQELGLPDVLSHLARRPNGLVLVTGPTGSGKSTTLAAMIDLINREKRVHIITLEDPIEYLHRHNLSIVNQREIGQDTQSFATALRAALREDPDVILVGEMRDLETIAIAITAAETGHLVFATLHTSSAAETIDRVIDVFPPSQQQQIRIQLANTIEGIVAQQLIPRIDRPGRVVALEILVATPAIRNLIREGKTFQIPSQLQTGARYGMQTLDMSLRLLYQKKMISKEEVLNRAHDPETIIRSIGS
jgi:pilus retraction protein PilT